MAMAIRRWDPFRDLMAIQNEMNRLFGRTYGENGGESELGTWAPALDVFEAGEKFTVVTELPGLTAGDVDISVEDGILSIKGERKFYDEVKEENFHRVERRFGSFVRRITLPQ
ncbi:MAG: Hsp20/alpha crystallin family protein, partial [Actinomycetota bacterium]